MGKVGCPICKTQCEEGDTTGDYRTYLCGSCGPYRLAHTAATMLVNGTRTAPDPEEFRRLVAERRGDSDTYPLFTSYDFE